MAQLTYTNAPEKGFSGMKADSSPEDVLTRANTEAATDIPFGVIVAQDTANDEGAKLPAASTAKLIGMNRWKDVVGELDLGADRNSLAPGAPMGVAQKGRWYMACETAWAAGDGAHVRYAGVGQKGAIRNAAVASETIDAGAVIRFVDTGAAAGVAQVELLFPGKL